MKKIQISLLILIGMGINAFAQESPENSIRDDSYFFVYSFDQAIDSYTHAAKLSMEGQRRLAISYHNTDQNIKSEATYSVLMSTSAENEPEDYYNYAMALKTNGNYIKSGKYMDTFREFIPLDLRAKDYAAHNAMLPNMLIDDGRYKIEHLDLNSDALDFGTCYYKNKIVFASSRITGKLIARIYNWTQKPFWDMYVSDVEDGKLKNPRIFDKSLNGKMNDGPASFSNNGTRIAFTRNDLNGKSIDGVVELQIYFSTCKDGKWLKPEPFIFNSSEYSVGHPSLTSDGNTMYFTSDMTGGYGGADIYRVTKDDMGQWEEPENLGGKINTEGDEMFPFIEENNGVLFFTSNGRFGLGGLDIFACAVNGSGFGRVHNAGFPLNTQYDDFAVIVDSQLNRGYFSSDRSGGSGGDDIYSFELLKGLNIGKKIEGITKDSNGTIIPNTLITLIDEKNNVIDTFTALDNGTFSFLVESDKNLKLNCQKEAYLESNSAINTFGKDFIVKADVVLLKKEVQVVSVTQPIADIKRKLVLNPVYFDLDKNNIRPDAEIELMNIVSLMNEYPDMIVESSSYTDSRAPKEYNLILSNKRAKATVDFIKKRITNPERIYGKGYGETMLLNGCADEGGIVTDCPESEHQKNRRTEFVIIKE